MFESPEQAEARRAYAQKKLEERGPKPPKKSWLTFQKSASMDSVTNAAREAETNWLDFDLNMHETTWLFQ